MTMGISFGETTVKNGVPVLNEREIRAAAGIFFVLLSLSVQIVIVQGRFTLLKYTITVFLLDFIARVFIHPKYSPSLIVGRFIVRNQVPEYVGAAQKKFAWAIGLFLASIMFTLLILFNAYSPITGILCITCLIFLFCESAFGICLGCKMYPLFFKDQLQYCPGEACDGKPKQEIQKISAFQLLSLIGFIGLIVIIHLAFHDLFNLNPYRLF